MFELLYIEEDVKNAAITKQICNRFTSRTPIYCEKYGEVFNRQNQNFRLQKENPSLILAKKHGNLVLEAPKGYGIGSHYNFYFSHLLNCPFDCRYCFLQGMYTSANFVLFVNYEDFQEAILKKIEEFPGETCYFFTGYDGDSLALESVTQFLKSFLPFFAKTKGAFFEIRTKSTNISPLLQNPPLENCIVAYSLMPKNLSENLEHKTPGIKKRIEAIQKLQKEGWKIGLRFDPLIYCDNFEEQYSELFEDVFSKLDLSLLHSVTLGAFRLPKGIYKNMIRLYPEEKIFAHSIAQRGNLISYNEDLEVGLLKFCYDKLLHYIPENLLFAYELTESVHA